MMASIHGYPVLQSSHACTRAAQIMLRSILYNLSSIVTAASRRGLTMPVGMGFVHAGRVVCLTFPSNRTCVSPALMSSRVHDDTIQGCLHS